MHSSSHLLTTWINGVFPNLMLGQITLHYNTPLLLSFHNCTKTIFKFPLIFIFVTKGLLCNVSQKILLKIGIPCVECQPNFASCCLHKAKEEVSTWILNWRWPCAFMRKAGSWGHWRVLWWTVQSCAWLRGMAIVWITAKQKELDSSGHSIISFENNGQNHGPQPLQLSWKSSSIQ